MTQDFTDLERLERYVNNEMSEPELTAFEQEMQENETLAQEFALFSDMLEGIHATGDDDLMNTIKTVDKKLKAENFFENREAENPKQRDARVIPMRRRWMRPLALAATFALLVLAGYFILDGSSSSSNLNALYAQYNQPEQTQILNILDHLQTQGFAGQETKAQQDSLTNALLPYKDKDYAKSIAALNDYLKAYPSDKVAQLYMGLSLKEINQLETASQYLLRLSRDEEFEQQELAQWHLALCYLGLKDEAANREAKKLLEGLQNSANEEYAAGAKAFLEVL